MHFLYVMNNDDKEKMIQMGYKLIKTHSNGKISVFENKDELSFSSDCELSHAGIRFVLSDVLTF